MLPRKLLCGSLSLYSYNYRAGDTNKVDIMGRTMLQWTSLSVIGAEYEQAQSIKKIAI